MGKSKRLWDNLIVFASLNSPTAMYNDLLDSTKVPVPDLSSNLPIDISGLSMVWMNASWREKHDGVKIMSLSLYAHDLVANTLTNGHLMRVEVHILLSGMFSISL